MGRLGCGDTGETGAAVPTGDDVEQFAALLRRLKDRTDRSYGSLARRVNMNTSTLHRYCAGEAVPQDYAPVERLAAFCGATPEERLELHRLWLLALTARQVTARQVTARQRPKAGDGAAEPAGAEGVRESAVGGGSRDRSLAEGVREPAVGERVPGPDRRAEPGGSHDDGREGSGSVPGAGPSASDAPRPGSPEPAPHADADAVAVADRRSTGRRWYRRRRTVVGAAVATVLLATLGSLPALSAGGSDGDPAAKAPVRSRTTGMGTAGTGAPARPSAASTGPSPGGSSSAPPSAKARPSGRPEVKGGPSAGAKSGAPVPTGVPLTWTADSQVWQGGCGHDYVIGKKPDQVPPPPVQQDAGAWAATQGAVHGRQTMVQISVQGKSSAAVVLTALRVRVVSRGTPLPGTAYAMEQGCGGDLTPREFSVNLDVDRPIAHARPGNDTGRPIPAVRFPYRVSAEDPEVLLVTATTEAHDCQWYLELDWSARGRTGTVRVDDHGRPFRTSGIKGLPRYWYGTNDQGVRQWVPADS
ncbi:helix-turn-helix domain-containing protein [Streptomyces sp900105245]|uniref:transcriptional regulator n=1 Tax=Streptomyces sp. 900105245 TaxID=3154379 RepID=UPI00331D0090